jgi:heme-degrading monooxygenase HmoA
MVTVGMNYEIIAGKEPQFEAVFDKVLAAMQDMPGHDQTQLFRAVKNARMYLIVSKWNDRTAFDAFIGSDQFRKVVDWGKEQILAGRPQHEVYGDDAAAPASAKPKAAGGCPVSHG